MINKLLQHGIPYGGMLLMTFCINTAGAQIRDRIARPVLRIDTTRIIAFPQRDAPSKVALLIGNSAYPGLNALETPVNDLAAIATGLDSLGFSVMTLKNGTREEMQNSIRAFHRRAKSARITYLYYAGHTVQFRDRNYLVPVDATLEEAGMIPRQGISLPGYFRGLNSNAENMISIDACYPNDYGFKNDETTEGPCFVPPGRLPPRTFVTFTSFQNMMAPSTAEKTSLFSYLFSFHIQKSASIYDIVLATKAQLKQLSGGREDISIFGEVSTSTNLKKNQVVMYSMNMPGFPWPPPKASAIDRIDRTFFSECQTLKDVDKLLFSALEKQEYYEKSYFRIAGDRLHGFAIATRLEQIHKDGTSMEGDARWRTKPSEDMAFSFSNYFKSLFFPQKGYFRVIVFVVADIPLSQSEEGASRNMALSWLSKGATQLPPEIANMSFSENHGVTALIYEYELPENDVKASLEDPSDLQGRDHLKRAKLWSTISNSE